MEKKETVIPLSKRLQTIVSFVTIGNTVADIGCDHGFVPIFLVKNGIAPKAIAMDIGKGPLQRAKEHIQQYNLEAQIETRLSNGMERLKQNEVDSVILSGIGGPLMIRILEEGKNIVSHLKELILSPQSEIEEVRRYLVVHDFWIKEETMVFEDGKYYVVMHVRTKEETRKEQITTAEKNLEKWTDLEYRYGKSLLEKREDTFLSYLDWEKRTKKQLLEHLKEADTERILERKKQLKKELAQIEDAITICGK